jgi:DNA-binding response OmpR family regulator
MSGQRILLIEDDVRLARSIAQYLQLNGFQVKHFEDGIKLEQLIDGRNFDLILCDVMLPGTDGFEIAEKIRHQFNGPYIFLTALNDFDNQIKGFELGADDYITKPIEPKLLLARINACLRRSQYKGETNTARVGDLFVDNAKRSAMANDEKLMLTRFEFDLLWQFATHPGQQLSREFLFVNTVGREYDGLDRTVDGRVSRLRKKT